MMQSQAKDVVNYWLVNDEKLFSYHTPLWPTEYVTFKKIPVYENGLLIGGRYKCTTSNSTMDLGEMDEEDFVKLLCSERLVLYNGWAKSAKDLKTGGCNCGAWILKDSTYLHDIKCYLWKDPWGKKK